jgi:hypothetical protein
MDFLFIVMRKLVPVFLLILCSCASYSNSFAPIAEKLAENRVPEALELLDKAKTPQRNQLLLLMNRGMLLRMDGQFAASNQDFAAAKQRVEALNALSLREQGTALAINDGTRSYAGAPYEQVMLNLYSALNYLELGELDAARVESLQVDLLLGELADKEVGPLFANDPFARYLSALIYEAEGEESDAMIAYRLAYEAYRQHGQRYPLPVPRQLQLDLLRLSAALDLSAENQKFVAEFGLEPGPGMEQLRTQGELIFLLQDGLAPVMVEEDLSLPVPPRGQWVRVALPAYLRRPPSFSGARLKIGGQVVETEMFENIEELAIAELERNRPAILARATARVLLKYQMNKKASKNNELAGLLVNVGNLLTERADTRSWMSLPANIQLARVVLPPGVYALEVELLGSEGNPGRKRRYPAVTLKAGKMTFISCHEVAERSLLGRR